MMEDDGRVSKCNFLCGTVSGFSGQFFGLSEQFLDCPESFWIVRTVF